MRLVNTNPTGESFILPLGLTLEPGEEFEVPDDYGIRLLEQAGNFHLAAGQKLDGFTVEQLNEVAEKRGHEVDSTAKKPEVVKAVTSLVTQKTED